MGFHLPGVVSAKRRSSSNGSQVVSTVADVPKGYLAVYVCDESKIIRYCCTFLGRFVCNLENSSVINMSAQQVNLCGVKCCSKTKNLEVK